ncbi:hypothetical protein W02_36370 [Nitrospira sp. KM1]|uniref:CGNR zinc finger domain-containing protein n=1 Tax=Nitrospira sp. KM1 TaxID=1936990 RepID=UPI0013A715E9|nr:ABATE domain-containing protein [Nitrospira sp. KM1]BCA56497.1 hypothetical protein W02_36370 [Nitrospira sp. KM1]
MIETSSRVPFLFVGNHRCLDFINTAIVLNGLPLDLLGSFDDLVAWLVQSEAIPAEVAKNVERRWHGPAKARALDQARVFREMLRAMVERIAGGKSIPHTVIEAVNEALRYRAGYQQVRRHGDSFALERHAEVNDADQLHAMLAESAADLLCEQDLTLVKKCQNPACVLFFYDTTKNHARHWCSMNLCGNRSKVAAHYRRQKRYS